MGADPGESIFRKLGNYDVGVGDKDRYIINIFLCSAAAFMLNVHAFSTTFLIYENE